MYWESHQRTEPKETQSVNFQMADFVKPRDLSKKNLRTVSLLGHLADTQNNSK